LAKARFGRDERLSLICGADSRSELWPRGTWRIFAVPCQSLAGSAILLDLPPDNADFDPTEQVFARFNCTTPSLANSKRPGKRSADSSTSSSRRMRKLSQKLMLRFRLKASRSTLLRPSRSECGKYATLRLFYCVQPRNP
jgi:hypothetical protein